MSKLTKKNKRKLRNRRKLKEVNNNRFRISVTKSLNHLSAQIIDDKAKKTLVSASSVDKDIKSQKKSKMELSTIVAETLARKANEKKIKKVYFDRGIFKYHGRVKIFAETLRKNGMEF